MSDVVIRPATRTAAGMFGAHWQERRLRNWRHMLRSKPLGARTGNPARWIGRSLVKSSATSRGTVTCRALPPWVQACPRRRRP